MPSCRKPMAAVAAVTAALALAVPAMSASAKTTQNPTVDPTVCGILNEGMGPFGPTMFLGGASLKNTLAQAGNTVGCPAAPSKPSLFSQFGG